MVESPYAWTIGNPSPLLEDHTQAKHTVLRRYTERYLEIVTQNVAQRVLNFTVVDGFAGGGRYTRNGIVVPGSPLLLLETVRSVERTLDSVRSNGFKINADFFFVENDPTTFDFLSQSIRESDYAAELGRSIHLMRGDFNSHADGIIDRIRKKGTAHRSLFLLDQCGWGQVPLATVRKVYHGLKWSEVFLTFGVDSLIDYLSDRTSDFRAAIAAELDDGFIQDLIRIRESEQVGWRALIQHGLYGHLRQHIEAKFISPFFLMSAKSHRALWFLHLSKHWRARDEVGVIHWDAASGAVDHRGDPGFKPLGFTPERRRDLNQLSFDFGFDDAARSRSREALHEQLCDAIVRLIEREHERPTVERLFYEYCNESPATSAMLKQSLQALRDEGELIIRRKDKVRSIGTTIDFGDEIERPSQPTIPGLLTTRRILK